MAGDCGGEAQLREWCQGDYSLDISQVLIASEVEGGDLVPDAGNAVGLVVVTQTCDIVNSGPGKEWVVVSPLIEGDENKLRNAANASTSLYAKLETPPAPNVIVDLGQAMTLSKSLLAKLERHQGLKTDAGRIKFADAIARRYGRFAFPDDISITTFLPLRDRLREKHGKGSPEGQAWASLAGIRVVASPSWDSDKVSIGFRFVLEPEGKRKIGRDEIAKVVSSHVGKLKLPKRYKFEDPPFTLLTTDDMTATEWINSQPLDLDFISISKPPK